MSRPAQPNSAVTWLHRTLNHVVTRTVLSAAIIVSLLPGEWIQEHDLWFLVIFLPEFIARVVLSCRYETDESPGSPGGGWRRPRLAEWALLTLDLVAMLSFVPITAFGISSQTTRWLRVFRLTRMLMLLRYWAPLARDLWAVMLRRERARQVALMGAVVLVFSFAGAVVLEHVAMRHQVDFDGNERFTENDKRFLVHLWWAFRQIQDPGNMLSNPAEIAALIVSLGLTVLGLFLVSFLIGLGTDVVRELMELSRIRPPGLRHHTVVINIGPSTRQLLYEMMRHYRKLLPERRVLSPGWWTELWQNARSDRKFVIVGTRHEPPDFLREPEMASVVYRQGSSADDEALLDRADVREARRIVILADIERGEPDDETIRTLLTMVERLQDQSNGSEEKHRLIAEILDESNVPAARRAIASANRDVQAYIVPTERLLALFIGCVSRRSALSGLLVELLTSHGHELYSYDYDRPSLTGSDPLELPDFSSRPEETMDQIFEYALTRIADHGVVPVGLLAPRSDEPGQLQAIINPRPEEELEAARTCGFVAIAPNFRAMTHLAHGLSEGERAGPRDPREISLPRLRRTEPGSFNRVLICGFRPASVNLVEALIVADPDANILIVVEDEDQRKRTLDEFDGHSNLVKKGLLRDRRGSFTINDGGVVRYISFDEPNKPMGRVVVAKGDWTSSRQLMALPLGFGPVTSMDQIILLSNERHGSDARTTTALMKIEALLDHAGREGGRKRQRIVAEVLDGELAQRLWRRYANLAKDDVRVFSIQELRAFFMFQSVVVPNFELVYGELMAPWGQSFIELECKGKGTGKIRFAELARNLRRKGMILAAVVMYDERGWRQLYVGEGDPEDEGWVDLSRLASLWVIADDRGAEAIELAPDEPDNEPDEPADTKGDPEPAEPAAQ